MYVCPKCLEENPRLGAQCPRDGAYFIPRSALEDAAEDPLISTMAADKYIITSLISEGGMGAVYRALQMPVEREVAFKVLRTELQDSDKGRERFIQEARAISKLSHPNIITLYDFGFEKTTHPYMVMEYAPGQNLTRWVQDPTLTTDRILHVAEQVLAALGEAHRQGVIHRDLKPDNMIVTRTGSDQDFVKLLDFGIARLINEGSTRNLTREGEVFGTPHYMAPEQAQGKKNVGPPADVYAMGVMLYEMLCGEAPFDATSPLAVLFMHINDPLPPLKPRPGLTVPKVIEDIIIRATQKKPEDRYADASQMLQALYDSVGRTTGVISTAAMPMIPSSDQPAISTPSPEFEEEEVATSPTWISHNTPAPTPAQPAETPAAVNLGQFAPSENNVAVTDPAASINTLPGDLAEERPKKSAPLIAAILIALILVSATAIFFLLPSKKTPLPQNNTAQEGSELPGTISAKVEIPVIDLKSIPEDPEETEKLAQNPETDNIKIETPESTNDFVDTKPEPGKTIQATANSKEKTTAKQASTKKTAPKSPGTQQNTSAPTKKNTTNTAVEPVKFSPPKFQAPDEIPTKFERPK